MEAKTPKGHLILMQFQSMTHPNDHNIQQKSFRMKKVEFYTKKFYINCFRYILYIVDRHYYCILQRTFQTHRYGGKVVGFILWCNQRLYIIKLLTYRNIDYSRIITNEKISKLPSVYHWSK